jgi:addiction module RelE/StbE family toxin
VPDPVWSALARADLLAILDHIATDNPDAAFELVEDIEQRTRSLSDHPRMGRQGRVEGTRELVVHANYIVVYADRTDGPVVLRVLHAARLWP